MWQAGAALFDGPSVLQILQLYKDYIDPDFTWANFTIEEQAKVIVAPRSNNLLDTERVSGMRYLAEAVAQQVVAVGTALCGLAALLPVVLCC